MTSIGICLADDHPILLSGIQALLNSEQGIDVVDICADLATSRAGTTTTIQITDFRLGDVIKSNKYDLYRRENDDSHETLANVFDAMTKPQDGFAEADFWHENRDGEDFTVIRINEEEYEVINEASLNSFSI